MTPREGTRRRRGWGALGAAILAAAVVLPLLPKEAGAAGAEAFEISGPGLEKPVEVSLYGLRTPELQDLPEQMGAWFLTSGEVVTPLMRASPTRALGPKYIVTWYLLGPPEVPRDERTVRQELYPDGSHPRWAADLVRRCGLVPSASPPFARIGDIGCAALEGVSGLQFSESRNPGCDRIHSCMPVSHEPGQKAALTPLRDIGVTSSGSRDDRAQPPRSGTGRTIQDHRAPPRPDDEEAARASACRAEAETRDRKEPVTLREVQPQASPTRNRRTCALLS